MNKLWTFGCSFTAEYNPIDGIFFPFENQYDKYRKYRGGTLPKVWVDLLAERIGYKPYNCAIGGSSNNKIFNQIVDDVKNGITTKNDLVVVSIGWCFHCAMTCPSNSRLIRSYRVHPR